MYHANKIKPLKMIKLVLKYPQTSFNILTDLARSKFLNNKISPFPRQINIFVTNRCNLNCPMCLNSVYRKENLGESDLDISLMAKILPELKKYKPFIYITGGEPLLNRDIFKIISLFSANGIFTSLTTNGFILESFAQKIIDSGLEFISVSLDHFEEGKHDKGRGVKTSYKRLIRGLEKLVALRKNTPSNIKINTVITKDNYKQLSKMYDFIEKLGIDEWSIQHYSFVNPATNKLIRNYVNKNGIGRYFEGVLINNNSYFEKEEVTVLLQQLEDVIKKNRYYKTKISIKPKMDNVFSYYQGKFPSNKSTCALTFDAITIIERSKVTLCLAYEIGSLDKAESLKELWQSKKTLKFQKLISRVKLLPSCFRCGSLDYVFNQV